MTVVLRPYQQKVAEEIWSALDQSGLNTLAVMVTGAGKTKLFAKMTELWSASGYETWIFVHRKELLLQASAALTQLGVPHGLVAPGRPMTRDLVQVASIDTVLARIKEIGSRLARVRRIVIDECHHIVSAKYRRVLAEMRDALMLGVTATPFRLDGAGLGDFFKKIVSGPAMRWMIANGYLTPYVIFNPSAKIDLSKVRKRAGDYVTGDLVAAVDRQEINEAAVAAYLKWLDGKPTIVFCASVEHAEHVAEQFKAAGYRAASLDGGMGDKERSDAIKGLGNGRIQVLTSCDIISEGTDIPIVTGAIMLRPTQSTALYLQQIGRVLRPAPGKTRAVVIDFVDNRKTHGMPDEERRWSLQGGVKGMEKAVAATSCCRYCRAAYVQGPTHCPECNRSCVRVAKPTLVKAADAPKPGQVVALPQNYGRDNPPSASGLAAFTDVEIAAMAFKALLKIARTKGELERVARIRNYSPKWVDHILSERGGYAGHAGYGHRRAARS